jgi:hypothetical protein
MGLTRRAAACGVLAIALASTTAAVRARAGEESSAPTDDGNIAAPAADDGGESRGAQRIRGILRRLDLDVRGRFLARVSRRSLSGSASDDLNVQNARLELRWTPNRRLRAVLEGDFAEKRFLKDAWLRLRLGAWAIRAGQFKPPVSAVELDSRWDLPTSERGLLREVLVDAMGIGGRRPGIETAVASKGHWDLDARVGLFLASHVRGDRIGDEAFNNFVTDYSLGAQKVAGRVAVSRKRIEVGAFGEWRAAKPLPEEGYKRYWTTGLDLTWSDKPAKGGRRLWADGYVGSSWQDSNAFDGRAATFLAGRVVGAWRRGGRASGKTYLEPYATFSLMDPDTSVRADVMWEAAGGLNVGKWDRLRVTLELQRRGFSRNVPESLGIFAFERMPAPPSAVTVVVVQVGGRF